MNFPEDEPDSDIFISDLRQKSILGTEYTYKTMHSHYPAEHFLTFHDDSDHN